MQRPHSSHFGTMDLYFQEHEVDPNASNNNNRRRGGRSSAASQQILSANLNALLINSINQPNPLRSSNSSNTNDNGDTNDGDVDMDARNSTFGLLPLLNLAVGDTNILPLDNSNGPPPASKQEIKNLPSIQLSQIPNSKNKSCPVCTDDFEQGQDITRLPCAHYFHRKCVIAWLSRHCSCPVCRKELTTDDEDYEYMRRVKRREQATAQMTTFMFN